MNKKPIDINEYASRIVSAIPSGVLVTTKADKVNSMVIGWGTLGYEWGRPMFTIYIREGRFTREQLDVNGEFTVNVPLDRLDHQIMKVCGSESGHNIDKVQAAGLTLADGSSVDVPAILEAPITLECKVVFRQKQELELIDPKFANFYPQDVDSTATGANCDAHFAYYGEIVNAYILEK